MKLWQGILLIIFLLAIMPLSACEYLGWGSQQQVSEEQIKAYQEYSDELNKYYEERQKAIEEAVTGAGE